MLTQSVGLFWFPRILWGRSPHAPPGGLAPPDPLAGALRCPRCRCLQQIGDVVGVCCEGRFAARAAVVGRGVGTLSGSLRGCFAVRSAVVRRGVGTLSGSLRGCFAARSAVVGSGVVLFFGSGVRGFAARSGVASGPGGWASAAGCFAAVVPSLRVRRGRCWGEKVRPSAGRRAWCLSALAAEFAFVAGVAVGG